MSADDPVDPLVRKLDEGKPVDWALAESSAALDGDTARALKDLERIAAFSRGLQRVETTRTDMSSDDGGAPERWGHLMLLERIGAGAQGEVWRAWDATLQRQVALKFLQTGEGLNLSSDLLSEARALARLRHPSIVAVYGVAEHDGRIGMWMEWIEGFSLAREIERRGSLPAREVARIGIELCSALEALEGAGVVHRDVKPANIVMETGGRVVLTDFGLGWRPAVDDTRAPRTSGTPIFMAPELLAGGEPGPRSDLYALGITLWWALAGRSPFEAKTMDELRGEAARGPSTPLRRARRDAPEALVEAIEWAMKPDANERPRSAAQLKDGLSIAIPGSLKTDSAMVGTPRISLFLSARRWKVGIALLVVLGLALWIAAGIRSASERRMPVWTARKIPVPEAITKDSNSSLSPDGVKIAFVSNSGAALSVLSIDASDTRTVDHLAAGEGRYINVTWNVDGSQLVAFRLDAGGNGSEVLVDPLTGHHEVIARFGKIGEQQAVSMYPTLSPDGRRLVVRSDFRPDTWRYHALRVYDVPSGPSRVLVRAGINEFILPAAWNPRAGRLAYVVAQGNANYSRIETCDLRGKRETVLVDSTNGLEPYSDDHPSLLWLDAHRLLYAQRPSRKGGLGDAVWWSTDVDDAGRPAGRPRLAYALPGAAVHSPSASKNGRLLFTAQRVFRSLQLVGTDGRGRYQGLTTGAQLVGLHHPVWSFDGTSLFVRSVENPAKPSIGRLNLSTGRFEPLVSVIRTNDRPLCPVPGDREVLCDIDSRLVAVPVAGGTPRVLATSFIGVVSYSTLARRWIAIEHVGTDLVVRDFSPATGLGPVHFRYSAPELQEDRAPAVAFSPDGKQLLVLRGDVRGFDVLDAANGRVVRGISVPSSLIPQSMCWAPDGKSVYASGMGISSTQFWVARLGENGMDRKIWDSKEAWAGGPAMSPDGATLAFASVRFNSELWLLERAR